MAQESDKNRKNSRNFSLEKTKKRSFDLEKEQPADVVTPTEESVADNVPSSEFPEAPDTGKPMKMTWTPLIFLRPLHIIRVGKSLLSIFQKGGVKSC